MASYSWWKGDVGHPPPTTIHQEGVWVVRFVRPRFTFFFFFVFLHAFVDFWETNFTVMNSKFTVHILC